MPKILNTQRCKSFERAFVTVDKQAGKKNAEMSFLLSYLLGISGSYKMLDLKYLTITTQETIKHGLHREFIKILYELYRKKKLTQ